MAKDCTKCRGTGNYLYSNTATYNDADSFVSGQAMTPDTCDVCWGSGDESNPGEDLRKAPTRP